MYQIKYVERKSKYILSSIYCFS